MRKVCPRCGGHLNPRLRGGGDITRPTPEDRLHEPHLIYDCTECRQTCFTATQVHEDRIEWFFDVVMPQVGKALVAFFLIAILLQLLGL